MSAGKPGAHGREEQDLRRCAVRERGLRDKEDLGEIHRRLLLCQACAPAPTPPPPVKPAAAPTAPVPAAIDPMAVAQAYVETANSGDFGKTYACYADDSGALLLTSKQQNGNQWLKDDVKATRATIQDVRMNGDVVIATGTVSPDRFKKLKINSVAYSAQYVIENGKIRFFYPTLQFTPDQAAKVQAAQQSQAAPTR